MASNSFGKQFRITTWGESHGKAIGVVIDGCPAGLPLTDREINDELFLRRGGKTPFTTPRGEKDQAQIYSGIFEGKTTGAPISIIIHNEDKDSSKYEAIKDLLRPGHANYTYLAKYGIFDWRGGGRSSARETACRVAAGAVAKKLLKHHGIEVIAYIHEIADIACPHLDLSLDQLRDKSRSSDIFCPDPATEAEMKKKMTKAKEEGDSVGGVITCCSTALPIGLGDPVYDKLEAKLAQAMMSIPATKGFEMGSGFAGSKMRGSEHNDAFAKDAKGNIITTTNHAGGTLGGISSGMPLSFNVAFKPTSSITVPQKTLTLSGKEAPFSIPEGSRHDPCVTIRAVPIVEAMASLVLIDALLCNLSSKV